MAMFTPWVMILLVNAVRMTQIETLTLHLLKIESSILFKWYDFYVINKKHLKNITKIAAGGNHNLALDHGGNLFGWGANTNMQLSHED